MSEPHAADVDDNARFPYEALAALNTARLSQRDTQPDLSCECHVHTTQK